MRVVHVTTSLTNGGAQAILFNLATRCRGSEQYVISLMGHGKYGKLLQDQGIPVYTLDNDQGRFSLASFNKIIRILKELRPDVIQTWMYHADLVGGLAGRIAGVSNIVWGVHNTKMQPSPSNRSTRLIVRLLSFLSKRIPRKIIVCSQQAMEQHIDMGYPRNKMCFIPNGYDLDRFNPVAKDLNGINSAIPNLGKDKSRFIMGCVGRWSEQKDQLNLVRACSVLLSGGMSDFVCVFIGPEMDKDNSGVTRAITENNLQDHVILAGEIDDIPVVMTSLDVHVLPSAFGEAYPNVVAEAMACGTPCIVTDVGDSEYMVDAYGWVVPPGDHAGLASAIISARKEVNTPAWAARKQGCRVFAMENFDITRMLIAYNEVWDVTLRK